MPRGDTDVAMDKSIAALPFIDSDNNGNEQYFSDRLSEHLIIALTQFSDLKVISRNSSFQFRDNRPDSASIGRKLGMAYLLQGSVRRAGGQVSINIELIKVSDGDTLWSQRYQRPYLGLFALQDAITTAVATALQAGKAAYQIAQVLAIRGERDQAFLWLDRALGNRDLGISLVLFDPLMAGLRADPRFAQFCTRAGLPVAGAGSLPLPSDTSARATH